MNVTLISYTLNPDALCGAAAAVCTRSDHPERALRGALSRGHASVGEHASFTFRVEDVSRVLLAQLTRHRIASFSVESQRYYDMRHMGAVCPASISGDQALCDEYVRLMERCVEFYNRAVGFGVPREDARYALPEATATNLIVTMNARELMHFFELRCCNRAQWEIRALADRMLRAVKDVAPALFDGAGPGCVRGACPEGKGNCGHPRGRGDWD